MAYSSLTTVMTNAVLKAAKPLRRDFGEVEKLQVSRKGTANFVTNADVRTEKILIEELSHARKNYSFLTEESGVSGDENAEYRFIIDPIDGTTNFIHAVPYFCISVAAEKRIGGKSEIIAGVIYNPISDEMFYAERGKGTMLNDRRVIVSRRSEDTLLATATPRAGRPNYEMAETSLHNVTAAGASVRCAGAAALDLAYLSVGRYDGVWYHHLHPWDIAAGILLVEEAGGRVTEINGGSNMLNSGSIVATNGVIHDELQQILSKAAA